jgi:hypothetical protein
MRPNSIPPMIGSPEWDLEQVPLGVDRAGLDGELADALDTGTEQVDPHSLDLAGEPAYVAAAWILFHQSHPSYGALLYLRFAWSDADQASRDWIVRQFAAMLIHGPAPVAESAEYGLWVDYVETPSDAPEVFDGLTAQLPHSHWHRLLSASGPIPWTVKRSRFQEAGDIPTLHGALAQGLAGSFYDVYGDVDAVEAAQLLKRITVDDAELMAALVEATTQPLMLRAGGAIIVDDASWPYPGSFLLDAEVSSGRWRWVPGSELVADGTVLGRMEHWDFPLDRTLARRAIAGRKLTGHHAFHRVEAAPEHLRSLVNRDLESWPPGLRVHLRNT